MPAAEFFDQFGILSVRNFLDRDSCSLLCEEMRQATQLKGMVDGVELHSDLAEEDFTGPRVVIDLPRSSVELVEKKLLEKLPTFEKYFQIKLEGIEPPGFAVYKERCGFKPHQDDYENNPEKPNLRKVSTVLFLNQETSVPQRDSYCGGNLTFHGLMKNKFFGEFGLPLNGEKGMLVAFVPHILHEVTPVTSGERFIVAGWYV